MGDFLFGTTLVLFVLWLICVIFMVCAMYSDNITNEDKHVLIPIMSFATGFISCAIITIFLYALLKI